MDDTRRAAGSRVGLWAGPLAALAVWLLWAPDLRRLGLLPGVEVPIDDAALRAVAAMAVWMAIWWMSEAVAIPVASLLPMVLLPWMIGTPFDIGRVAANYANWRVYLFFGGFLIAIAMESSGLHRRVALRTIRRVGTRPRRIVLGFMLASALLSMWISNTATALMMLPVGMAVIEQFQGQRRFGVALMLGIAYGASIGGVATPIGTPPNIAFQGIYAGLYPLAPPIGFGEWMAFALPLSVVFLVVAWLVLVSRVSPRFADAEAVIEHQIELLGPISRRELRVAGVFLGTAFLWVFRRPIPLGALVVPGWGDWLSVDGLNDGVVALSMGLLLFLLPSGERGERLLQWRVVERKMPWGILLLFGGGFALADAVGASGLSTYIGSGFAALAGLSPWLLIAISAATLTFLTEITSNTATAQVMLPLAAAVATATAQINPLVMMLPVTVAASFAFMLPVATPPNAVVFGSGVVPIREMVRHGLVLNLIGIVLLTLACLWLAPGVFGIDMAAGVPSWVR